MKINIFQIYFKQEQLAFLDPAFTPYDNIANPCPKWCEYYIFQKEFQNKSYLQHDYSGYVSWKFNKKTSISGSQFIKFIEENPGGDVYFINPFHGAVTHMKNVWMHGERWHPGMLKIAQKIFDTTYPSLNIRIEQIINPAEDFAFCNYWAGNAKFWEAYINFCEPAFDYIENKATAEEKNFLDTIIEPGHSMSYRPYIMERMFSTLLWLVRTGKHQSLKAKYYNYKNPEDSLPLARAINSIKHLGLKAENSSFALELLDNIEEAAKQELEIHEIKEQNAALKDELAKHVEQVKSLEAMRHTATCKVDELTLIRDNLRKNIEILEKSLSGKESELLLAKLKTEELEKNLDLILNSSSWKVTKPLRLVSDALKRPS